MIKKICIDWGNTLCKVSGEYSGPMVEWPEINLLPGVHDALSKLQKRCELFIATNAKDSTQEQIDAVMERVECSKYFHHIYTPREIGFGKESVEYYQVIARDLGCLPDEILMVGDDYNLDIRNAWEAGFQTAWFNPLREMCPSMYLPLHQYEVLSWAELVEHLEVPRPTLQMAFSWLQKERATFVLLQHIQSVSAIAYWFATHLRQSGEAMDAILVHRAAFLHDLDKLSPNRAADQHGFRGAEILEEKGYPQLAEIVRSHVITLPDKLDLPSEAAELVLLADKMVKKNRIVTIEERYDDLEERYPENKKFRSTVEPFLLEMKANVCRKIGIDPDDFLDQIKSDLMGRLGN